MGDLEKLAVVEEEEERLVEEVSVLDFDLLCSTVALQTQGKWKKIESEDLEYGGGSSGVFRMWEGETLDCFDDKRIAIESFCCPCYRFGKNMGRAGFGCCFLQATAHYALALTALFNLIAFVVTKKHCFLYLAIAFTVSMGMYLGFFRTRMRKKFNIRVGSDNSLDDCIYHLFCPCCALFQESRTLEMNNVQDGTWHGRSDTICVGTHSEGSRSLFELHPPPIESIKAIDTNKSTGAVNHP